MQKYQINPKYCFPEDLINLYNILQDGRVTYTYDKDTSDYVFEKVNYAYRGHFYGDYFKRTWSSMDYVLPYEFDNEYNLELINFIHENFPALSKYIKINGVPTVKFGLCRQIKPNYVESDKYIEEFKHLFLENETVQDIISIIYYVQLVHYDGTYISEYDKRLVINTRFMKKMYHLIINLHLDKYLITKFMNEKATSSPIKICENDIIPPDDSEVIEDTNEFRYVASIESIFDARIDPTRFQQLLNS